MVGILIAPRMLRSLPVLALCLALLGMEGCSLSRPPGSTQVLRAQAVDGSELTPVPVSLNVPATSAALNDAARYLAGMPSLTGQDAFQSFRNDAAWKEHASRMNELWQGFDSRHGGPVSLWARTHIPDLQGARAVFYPFIGPDFIFSYLFYPNAETYLLCGLEPCEPLPEWNSLSPGDAASGLEGLATSLNTVLHFSYFITKDMRHDLQSTRFRGVLPVFMVFLARSGHVVDSVDAVRLDANGAPLIYAAGQTSVSGFFIRAHGPHGPKRIFYFSHDLSNGGFSSSTPLGRFAAALGRPAGMLKSASYLMHESEFSNIRHHLLTQTCGIVQDPSGIPYQSYLQSGWRVSLYGNYQGTIDTFTQFPQPDLTAAYQNPSNHAEPLSYSIGYLLNPSTTSLMVGRPK